MTLVFVDGDGHVASSEILRSQNWFWIKFRFRDCPGRQVMEDLA